MTPDKQRIAIAQACGVIRLTTVAETLPAMLEWLQEKPHPNAQLTKPPWCEILKGNKIPDYLNDLNAVSEARKCLPQGMLGAFCFNLGRVLGIGDEIAGWLDGFYLVHATAAQQCEAILRTLRLWEDDSQ